MAAIRDEFLALVRAPLALWVWLVCSVLTGVAGPFGTYDGMPFATRLVFWASLIAASLLVSYFLCATLKVMRPKLTDWVHDGIVVVLFTVLFTPFVVAALNMATPLPTSLGISLWSLASEVMVISASVAVLIRVAKRRWPSLGTDSTPEQEIAPSQPRLMRRLNGLAASDVLRMTVQDHYVEVVVRGGPSQRILMRFADAVEEIDGLEGFCVHRSHWVVRAAILGVVTQNGREMIEMIDGSSVPVSRTYRPNLIAAGLICPETNRAVG